MTHGTPPGMPRQTFPRDPELPDVPDEIVEAASAVSDTCGTAPNEDAAAVAELKKKELVEAVVARSGIRKRDAKPAVEAALRVMGEALAEGRGLNLLPMGKLRVTRMKTGTNGLILNARLRQPDEGPICLQDPLAQAAE